MIHRFNADIRNTYYVSFATLGKTTMSISFVKWQPWQEVENVRNQLDQLFEEMTPIARETFVQNRPIRVPPIELLGTDIDLILKVELPRLEGKELDIQVTREAVSIRGALVQTVNSMAQNDSQANALAPIKPPVKTPAPRLYRSEFRTQTFHRVVPLPVEVDNENVHAEFKNGILTLTLPKLVRDRHHAVKVVV